MMKYDADDDDDDDDDAYDVEGYLRSKTGG